MCSINKNLNVFFLEHNKAIKTQAQLNPYNIDNEYSIIKQWLLKNILKYKVIFWNLQNEEGDRRGHLGPPPRGWRAWIKTKDQVCLISLRIGARNEVSLQVQFVMY